ncbi:MAG TPA: RdgB/HAM1 family non-canonical purine NTP pyrophosphatase [Steroidobacteraceae bacterium]|nr:RdgB/HAM1 family non-canonical purine NTP pyrophosphatase [Steroidobacteraceae bacterium]
MSQHLARLVVASSNPGKLAELGSLLAGLAGEIVPQSALGIAPAAETALTFEDNALLKARHAARLSGSAALADDSGLEVDALGGEPGVHSARYAGPGASDAANNAKLLAALAGTHAPRRARYRCVIALVMGADDPAPRVATGSWEGRIALAPRGTGGFGYDPLFLVGEGALTAAELPPAVKNRISHRALALRALATGLDRKW